MSLSVACNMLLQTETEGERIAKSIAVEATENPEGGMEPGAKLVILWLTPFVTVPMLFLFPPIAPKLAYPFTFLLFR